jgi:undecaprenyl-diphosphatase
MPNGRVRPLELVALIGGLVALVGSWTAVSSAESAPSWEASLFRWFNRWPDGLRVVLWLPMQLGSLVGSLAVVGVTWLVSRNVRLAAAALVASQLSWWSAKLVKDVVGRGRPAALLADVRVREHAAGFGYVSGHAAVAFSFVAVLAPSLPRPWRSVAVVLAVVVGVARMYMGAHLPMDVVGGAGLGAIVGTLTRWAFNPDSQNRRVGHVVSDNAA